MDETIAVVIGVLFANLTADRLHVAGNRRMLYWWIADPAEAVGVPPGQTPPFDRAGM